MEPIKSDPIEQRIVEKLSDMLDFYVCNKCGYCGKAGPEHGYCDYHAFRSPTYAKALELEFALRKAEQERMEYKFWLDNVAAVLLGKSVEDRPTYTPHTLASETTQLKQERDEAQRDSERLRKALDAVKRLAYSHKATYSDIATYCINALGLDAALSAHKAEDSPPDREAQTGSQ